MLIHEMTLPQYIQSMKGKRIEHWHLNRLGQLQSNHQNAVISELDAGRQVSAEVLKSLAYPLEHQFKRTLESRGTLPEGIKHYE